MRRWVLPFMIAAAVLVAGCASGKDGTDVTGRSAQSASATPTSGDPTDAGEEGLGTPDPVETTADAPKNFAMGYKATITNDTDGDLLYVTVGQPRTVRPDEFNKPEKGRYLAVTVTYERWPPRRTSTRST